MQAVRTMACLFAAYCGFAEHAAAQIRDPTGDSIRGPSRSVQTCWLDGMDDLVISNVRGVIAGTGVVFSSSGATHTENGDDRVAQTDLGDADVCIRTHGVVVFSHDLSFIESISDGGFVVMASKSGGRTMELTLAQAGLERTISWRVDGSAREFGLDAANWEERHHTYSCILPWLGESPSARPSRGRPGQPSARHWRAGTAEPAQAGKA